MLAMHRKFFLSKLWPIHSHRCIVSLDDSALRMAHTAFSVEKADTVTVLWKSAIHSSENRNQFQEVYWWSMMGRSEDAVPKSYS